MTSPFRLHLVTYNVANTEPPDDYTKLLKLDSKELPNLYAIGLQELKHSPGALLSDAIYDDPWTHTLTECLCKLNYVRVKSVRLLGLHLAVFVRRIDQHLLFNIESEVTATGFRGLWGNKGGVTVRMSISGVSVCFVNCHLAAHMENVANRIEDYDQIVEDQTFRDPDTDNVLDHDYVFWMGDLNFRLQDISKSEVERIIASGNFKSLWQHDQLKEVMEEELVLLNFKEGPLMFPPSYKYDKGTDNYDMSKKKRIPGWCDRILWLTHEDSFEGCDLGVQQLSYHSIQDYKISDHKPVISEFVIQVLGFPVDLPVMFEPMGVWHRYTNQKVSYSVLPSYGVQPKDWIGLYKANYQHPHDYVTYVWSGQTGESMGDGTMLYDIAFSKDYISELEGFYCLCYFSYKKNCIIGYSDTFKISATDEESSESTDSSDSNSYHGRMSKGVKYRKM